MQKVSIITCLSFILIGFLIRDSIAQGVTFTGSSKSIISTTAMVPEGRKLFFTSGLTAAAIQADLPDGNYEKYGDTEAQALDILKKFEVIFTENGLSFKDVFSMKVFVSPDTKTGKYDFDGWNRAYKQFFGTKENPVKPVRATLGVATLVNPNKFIEIELIAVIPEK